MPPEFFEKIRRTMIMALKSGANNVPPLSVSGPDRAPFRNSRHQRDFITACHRGFEKAQNQLILLLSELEGETDQEEKARLTLIVRKIADGIAIQMVQFQTHTMRRFCLHDVAPSFDLKTAEIAVTEANRLNSESRLTFALAADLTTFIHIADILRIDFRDGGKVSLIELKSGAVNTLLLSALDKYRPEPESLNKIKSDPDIQERHKKQAQRILRQRVRLNRAARIIQTDRGIDPKHEVPIMQFGPTVDTIEYDAMVGSACDTAKATKVGAFTVNYCMHVGVGFGETSAEANKHAFKAINYALYCEMKNRPSGFDDIEQEVVQAIGEDKRARFQLLDLFLNNLFSIATRPFWAWQIKEEHILNLLTGRLRILAVFDLAKFIWLARNEGAQIIFATRRETEEMKGKFGAINVATWSQRGVKYQYGEFTIFLSTGVLGRIMNDLMTPLQVIREILIAKSGNAKRMAEFLH